jgi:UDP-N-acetylglucosamine:LPS N-acetylglucosamine transferase
MIKVAIVGYGNLGRGVTLAVNKCDDMECVGIFTRRSPESITPVINYPVYSMDKLDEFKGKVDVLILCGGSATDLPNTTANLLKNFKVIAQLFKSLKLAKKIIKEFKPDVAVGVGGYASGPTLWCAAGEKIPTVIQEQNSYAGVTNKLLSKKAKAICVAYEGMERFFPEENIILTGNPVRKGLTQEVSRDEALEYFGLDKNKKTIRKSL